MRSGCFSKAVRANPSAKDIGVQVRRDVFGNVIRGPGKDQTDKYRFEPHHWIPHNKGGRTDLDNCEPVHWKIH